MSKIRLELVDWMNVMDKTKETIRQLLVDLSINEKILDHVERKIKSFETEKNEKEAVAS